VSETIGDGVNNQGNAGNISVATARLNLSGTSLFNTTSRGSTGNAGNISVDATDSVAISGSGTQLVSASAEFSLGNAGNISITAPSIVVENGGSISSNTGLSGSAGTITVNTNNLQLLSGGQITSRSLLEFPETPPSGTAGAVTVKGLPNLAQSILINGSRSGIFTDTSGSGPGGNINVSAHSITLQNGGMLSAKTSGTEASAIGGTITVNANHVQLHSDATITAKSNGVANAGNINVTAADGLTMQNGSSITTLVDQNATGSTARGGNIKVTTSPAATVNIQDSTISASVPGSGDGGNVTIDPHFVILQNGRILSQTDQGTGGNIKITARVFLPDAGTVISADATRGVNGTVTIQSPYAPAGGKIQPMVNRPLQATSLLNQSCVAMAGGQFSSFTVAGNRLPIEPGGWLSSPLVLGTTESNGSRMTNIRLGTNLVELRGERAPLWLREIAPPGFLTKIFAAPLPGGCAS
jgi:large exoprotein involved in heme utilization and adhesion